MKRDRIEKLADISGWANPLFNQVQYQLTSCLGACSEIVCVSYGTNASRNFHVVKFQENKLDDKTVCECIGLCARSSHRALGTDK